MPAPRDIDKAKEAQAFNFFIEELKAWRDKRTFQLLSPLTVRSIIKDLLRGGNFRKYSERYVAELTTIYASWLLHVLVSSKRLLGPEWRPRLLTLAKSRKEKDLKNLRCWLLTATGKTVVNLAADGSDESYLRDLLGENADRVATHHWGNNYSTLMGSTPGAQDVRFDHEESTYLLRVIGSSVLAIRGAVKSTFGKRLERAFLKTSFGLLGMREGVHYRLNSRPTGGKGRERDAVVVLDAAQKREMIVEMGLIGSGNSEIINDKIKRVFDTKTAERGIVIYDKLPATSTAFGNAKKLQVELVCLRSEHHASPAHHLYDYLSKRAKYSLKQPPALSRLAELVDKMPDEYFQLGLATIVPEDAEAESGSS